MGGVQAGTLTPFYIHHMVWPTLGTTTEASHFLDSQSLLQGWISTYPTPSPWLVLLLQFLSVTPLSQLTDKNRLSHSKNKPSKDPVSFLTTVPLQGPLQLWTLWLNRFLRFENRLHV